MELQVMILDDEYIILDGLCSFPWSDYGYRISATARNGLEGQTVNTLFKQLFLGV